MDDLLSPHCPAERDFWTGLERSTIGKLDETGWRVMQRTDANGVALAKWKCTKFRFAKLRGICEDGLKYRLQFAGR